MPKLENFVTFIKINGNPFAKNAVNYQITNDDSVGIYYTNDRDQRILKGTMARFDDWTDLNDNSYTSFTQLTDDLNSFLFYISGDYNLEVLLGNIPGHSMVSINGHTSTLSTTDVTISPGLITTDIDQSGLHATAATVDVASTDANDTSDGTGLRTGRLFGLDADGNNQNEIITMGGQSEVTSALLYSAIQGFRGLTAGSSNANEGIIYIGNGTFTAGVPDTIYGTAEAEHNKALFAYYTVPTSKRLVLRQLTLTMIGSNKEAEVNIETSSDGIFWITENPFGLESGIDFQGQIKAVPPLAAGNHIRIHGEGGGAGTELTTILGCELVDV